MEHDYRPFDVSLVFDSCGQCKICANCGLKKCDSDNNKNKVWWIDKLMIEEELTCTETLMKSVME